MAGVNIYGYTGGANYWYPVGADVYARFSRDDDYTFLPFITPTQAMETVAPQVGQASFRFDFGIVQYSELGQFEKFDPYTLSRANVCIKVYDYWGDAFLWDGIVDLETVRPHGADTVSQGEQVFTAFTLEHALDRGQIIGAFCDDGFGDVQYIDRPMRFNRRGQRGLNIVGNRFPDANYFGGGPEPETWTNVDILDYIIDFYVPSDITWIGCGQLASLENTIEEYDFEGSTVFEAMNRLIDRRKGVGWRCVSVGGPEIYIYVFSMASEGFAFGGAVLEPNPDQSIISFTGIRNVDPVVSFNGLAMYEQIIVKGGPISSTASFSYADGTLEEGWTPESEVDYNAGSGDGEDTDKNDAARASEIFEAVFAKHNLVTDWLGYAGDGEGGDVFNALPGYWPDAEPDADLLGNFFRLDHVFERTIPFEVESNTSDQPEYRKAFALFLVDPSGTYNPDDIPDPDLRVWAYADKLESVGKDLKNLVMTIGDRDLSIIVKGTPNLLTGLGAFSDADPASNAVPEVEYTTMIATVSLRTDSHLKATFTFPWWTGDGRVKLLEDRDAEAWYVAPGTVIEVVDGELVRHDGGFIRDDSERLADKALLAAAWFGTPRATLAVDMGFIYIGHPCGTMIRGMEGPEGYTEIGTVVTQRTWTFSGEGCKTTIQTGYEELDFGSLIRRGNRPLSRHSVAT